MPKEKPDSTPATVHDIEVWGGQIQDQIQKTKTELRAEVRKDIEKIVGTKIDQAFKENRDYMDKKIESYLEKRSEDLLGVKKDEIKLIHDKSKNHEERITTLEQKVGA